MQLLQFTSLLEIGKYLALHPIKNPKLAMPVIIVQAQLQDA